MKSLTLIKEAVFHLFYPHICAGCGTDILPEESSLCIKCIHQLPVTGFEKYADNPIEKIFSGRLTFSKATAQLYFTKHSTLQNLMHAFKYRNDKHLGHQLGIIMGNQLLESKRFNDIDLLIPLPLHESRERKRGYNQAEILCSGIAEVLKIPVKNDILVRSKITDTQTTKHRVERWKNMMDSFTLSNKEIIENKNVLLLDDVITTGATMEACGETLINVKGITLNIGALCFASQL